MIQQSWRLGISKLAGVSLVAAADGTVLMSELTPFLKGFALFFWATATWWISMLITLGVWRHIYKRYPLAYDPQYRGLTFYRKNHLPANSAKALAPKCADNNC
ncbi:MAG: hypothetical protein KDA72_01915 [Planctomycetales bacterium]|nr:hypothetical protein [Planctomycetales bacterium]